MCRIASASATRKTTEAPTRTSWPAIWLRPNHWMRSGRFTNSPWRTRLRPWRSVTMVASVTTMDGRRRPATRRPLTAPSSAPSATEAGRTSRSGQPRAARRPAHTLHTENIEPTEMSICRVMMTQAMPQATTRVGASRVSSERSGCGEKNAGAKIAMPTRTAASAPRTDSSRKERFMRPLSRWCRGRRP